MTAFLGLFVILLILVGAFVLLGIRPIYVAEGRDTSKIDAIPESYLQYVNQKTKE